MKRIKPLPDQNQNYWQLASIQSAAFGVPALQFGASLGKIVTPATAVIAICLGNILLWLLGLRIIGMTTKGRKNAMDNFAEYITFGRWIGGIALFVAFLLWFTIQIKGVVSEIRVALDPHINVNTTGFDIRLGAAIGLIISLLSIGGIKLIKCFNVFVFPFLMIFLFLAVFKNESYPALTFIRKGELSWSLWTSSFFGAVFSALSLTLAGIVNLPTFFRHRCSEFDAIFALPIFIFFTALIECMAVFLVNSDTGDFFTKYMNESVFYAYLSSIFLVTAAVSANLVNIYFASAVWEVLIPWASRAKELAIIGMSGTVVYIFFQSEALMSYGEFLFTTFIGILGIVVLIAHAAKILVEHRERSWELALNLIYWIIGCIVVVLVQNVKLDYSKIAFVLGVVSSACLLWITLFIEEIVWGINKIVFKK